MLVGGNMSQDEFRKEVILRLSMIVGALGDVAEAIKAIPAKAPPSSRRGGK